MEKKKKKIEENTNEIGSASINLFTYGCGKVSSMVQKICDNRKSTKVKKTLKEEKLWKMNRLKLLTLVETD